jgi:hypothetical protein
MAAAGEFAIVLGDRIPIASRNLCRIGVADGAAMVLIELAPQLQFQRVYAADELLVHLFDQGGIPGETFGIETAHLIDERLQLLPRFGAILHSGANLVEDVQTLVDVALGIGRVGTLLGRHGLAHDVSIAGVKVAIRGTTAIPTGRIPHWTGETIAHRTRLASAALTALLLATSTLASALTALLTALAALLTGLLTGLTALLAGLAALPVAAELLTSHRLAASARLTLLTWSRLTLSRLSVGTSTKTGELIA